MGLYVWCACICVCVFIRTDVGACVSCMLRPVRVSADTWAIKSNNPHETRKSDSTQLSCS